MMRNLLKQKKLQYNSIDDALKELNAQDKGRYFLCTCPECDKEEAFIYKNNLSFVQCNRENYCGERMILEYKEKVSEKEIKKQQQSTDYPTLSNDQAGSMDWAVRSFYHIKNYFKSDTLQNGYRGLSKETTKDYIVDLGNDKFISLVFKKLEPLIGKDYSKNDWMCKRNLVFPIHGEDGNLDRILLRSSIDENIEPKEIQLIANPSRETRDFFVDIPQDAKKVVISESIIDALSFRELDNNIGFIALTGSSKTRKVKEYLSQHKGLFKDKHLLLALDDDKAGKKATFELSKVIEEKEIGKSRSVFRYNELSNDANEFLMSDREGFGKAFEKSQGQIRNASFEYER